MNRLSAEYWDRIQRTVMLRILTTIAAERDEATEGGRQYDEVKVSPELEQAMMNVEQAAPQPQGMV